MFVLQYLEQSGLNYIKYQFIEKMVTVPKARIEWMVFRYFTLDRRRTHFDKSFRWTTSQNHSIKGQKYLFYNQLVPPRNLTHINLGL